MDGCLVSGSSSNSEGGGGNKGPAPRFAYTDAFNRVFPYYLSIGMTYELFWEKDATLVEHYRKAGKNTARPVQSKRMVARCLYL